MQSGRISFYLSFGNYEQLYRQYIIQKLNDCNSINWAFIFNNSFRQKKLRLKMKSSERSMIASNPYNKKANYNKMCNQNVQKTPQICLAQHRTSLHSAPVVSRRILHAANKQEAQRNNAQMLDPRMSSFVSSFFVWLCFLSFLLFVIHDIIMSSHRMVRPSVKKTFSSILFYLKCIQIKKYDNDITKIRSCSRQQRRFSAILKLMFLIQKSLIIESTGYLVQVCTFNFWRNVV